MEAAEDYDGPLRLDIQGRVFQPARQYSWTIPVLTGSSSISIDSESRFQYVSTGGNTGGGILVLDLHHNMLVPTVVMGDQTFGGTVSQNGDFVYTIFLNVPTLLIPVGADNTVSPGAPGKDSRQPFRRAEYETLSTWTSAARV